MRARYAVILLLAAACKREPLGRGTAVQLFVSPACPIANRYAPEIARIAARFAGRVDFLLVYPDSSNDEMSAHRRAYDLTAVPAVRDPTHKLVATAHVEVTPEAALFKDGALVWHGRIDDRYADVAHERPAPTTHDLEDAVAALVDGRALPPAHPAVGCAIELR
ncbi:MAG: hypothetical protein JWM53_1599 [bacterium]|nr:hypothetical protein [bacterium]